VVKKIGIAAIIGTALTTKSKLLCHPLILSLKLIINILKLGKLPGGQH
jgi:hypothetical protein